MNRPYQRIATIGMITVWRARCGNGWITRHISPDASAQLFYHDLLPAARIESTLSMKRRLLQAAKAKIGTSLDRSSFTWTIERRMPITAELTEADFMGNIDEVNYSALIMVDTIPTALRTQTGN